MATENKVVSIRLGALEKVFLERCEKDNLKPSELLKLSLRSYLGKDEKSPKDISFSVRKFASEPMKKRIEITLTESELSALESVMNLTFYQSYQAVIVGILRAYFLNSAVFHTQEITELRQANAALNAIGRNLNQVIKLIHLGDMEAARALNETNMDKVVAALNAHSAYCKKVINTATLRTRFNQD